MKIVILILIGYLVGSIPSGLIIGRLLADIDIRNHGSGNLGATNAFRILGVKGGLMVTIADIFKGVIPALLGLIWIGELGTIVAGASAIFGHSYPLFAGLRGGKGIATGAGVFLVLMPAAIGIAAITFTTVLFTTQYVSLASLLGALTLAAASIILKQGAWQITACVLVFIFVVYRHRANIDRLLHGRENKAKLRKSRF